jgi:histone-lysine N-methyltransferase SETMAR
MVKNFYGDKGMSRIHCYELFKRFKDGRQSTHYEPRLGRLSTSCDDAHVAQFRETVRSNRRLTVQEIVEGSCHDILTTKLEMHRVVAKFVPRLLTQDQRDSRVAICEELLDRTSEDENFLKRIIIGGEKLVYGYDVETKMQSSQWVGKNFPRPEKAVKVMLTGFFDIEGVVHHEFLPQGQAVNR